MFMDRPKLDLNDPNLMEVFRVFAVRKMKAVVIGGDKELLLCDH